MKVGELTIAQRPAGMTPIKTGRRFPRARKSGQRYTQMFEWVHRMRGGL